jgi:hypothetical protein
MSLGSERKLFMCLGVFVASGQPLDLVPWDDQLPAFNVVPLSEHEEAVRGQFSLSHVVYAGAHTGCSCGFLSDKDDPPAVSRSRAALVEYIRRAVQVGPVEVFVCWEGDYGKAAHVRGERSPEALASDEEWLQELVFTRIARLAA